MGITFICAATLAYLLLPFTQRETVLSRIKKSRQVATLVVMKAGAPAPTKITVDPQESFLYFTTHASSPLQPYPAISRLDLAHHSTPSVVEGYGSRDILYDARRKQIVVAEHDGESLLVINADPFERKKRIRVSKLLPFHTDKIRIAATGGKTMPNNLALDTNMNTLFLATEMGYLFAFSLDTKQWQKIKSFREGFCALSLNAKKEQLFVSSCASLMQPFGAIYILDARSLGIVKKRKAPMWFGFDLWLDEPHHEVWMTNFLYGTVLGLDAQTLAVKQEYATGVGTREIEGSPDGKYLYVGNFGRGTIQILERDSGALLKKIYVGPAVRDIFVSPKTGRVFVATSLGIFEILQPRP